jgi:hypothetical protein
MICFETEEQKSIVLQCVANAGLQTTPSQIREAAEQWGALLDALQAAEVGPCPDCPAPGSD